MSIVRKSQGNKGDYALFPFLVVHVEFVKRLVDIVPASVHEQGEDGLRAEVGLGGVLWVWREAQHELEVDRVF